MKTVCNARNGMFHVLIAIVALALLSSCATTGSVLKPVPPGNGYALVHFIRYKYPPYIHEVRILVNNQLAATLANNDSVSVNAPVGINTIIVDVTDGKTLTFKLPVPKAIDEYVVLTGDVSNVGQGFRGNLIYVQLRWNVRAYVVDLQQAQSILAEAGKHLN